VPCKHLAAVCYVLAEAFDDDPFEMLAWRGRTRNALLAALRQAGPRPASSAAGSARAAADDPAVSAHAASADAASATHAVLADVTGPPLARALDGFWTPGLSQARLRALAAPSATPATPDLLLRMFDPPALTVRDKDLRDVLASAYEQFPADNELSCAISTGKWRVIPHNVRPGSPEERNATGLGGPAQLVVLARQGDALVRCEFEIGAVVRR
jgi:uncharacterized Zn finger protein